MHWRTEQMIAGYKRNPAEEPTDQNRGNLLGEPKENTEVIVMDNKKLQEIIGYHGKWLSGCGGACANLSLANLCYANLRDANLRDAKLRGADLRDANLRGADLRDANLRGAYLRDANLRDAKLCGTDLCGADLRGAYLCGANLCGADLRGADLRGADLRGANLCYADLRGADLRDANLHDANLRDANLRDAKLRGAYLCGADLRGANLCGADLCGADLRGADRNDRTVGTEISCPEEGSFIGYKKASGKIVVLKIPEDARRSSATTKKCRCDKALVIRIEDMDGTISSETLVASSYDSNFIYEVGKEVSEPKFNADRWDECSNGIHFFINKETARRY